MLRAQHLLHCIITSSGTVSPMRLSDFLFPGSSTVTAQRTPDDAWQMSKRVEGWSQMCL